MGRWSIEGFLTPPSFRYLVNYIGWLNFKHSTEWRSSAEWRRIGECCLGVAASQIATLELGTETADACALSGSISGAGKSIEIRLRMCGPPLSVKQCISKLPWKKEANWDITRHWTVEKVLEEILRDLNLRRCLDLCQWVQVRRQTALRAKEVRPVLLQEWSQEMRRLFMQEQHLCTT